MQAYGTYIRYALGGISAILGVAFLFIPFIPLGYVLIFLALFILAPKIPFLRKYLRFLKKKDKNGHLKRIEETMNEWESSLAEEENKSTNK
ncbi:hypothetical protein [Marinoscillum sp.]|uniref:hypothetical protein n=1 Tax=Marinoscillum sp. TaxID=2024838 RepID=UPI003BA91B61